jgi:hypothetical protein
MSERGELSWRKSSRSTSGACVEVAPDGPVVHMRDSKDPDGPMLTVDRQAFADFIAFVAAEDWS